MCDNKRNSEDYGLNFEKDIYLKLAEAEEEANRTSEMYSGKEVRSAMLNVIYGQ